MTPVPTGKVHPVADYFPMVSDEEMAELAESIKTNGLMHAIVLDAEGTLIDGRSRQAACKLAGVEPRYVDLQVPAPGANAVAYIVAANITRRVLNQGQRAMLVAKVTNFCGQKSWGGKGLVAEGLKVSQSRLSYAITVLEYAPELADQVIAGGALDQAYGIALDRKKAATAAAKALASLRKGHPGLAAQVDAGELTLRQAVAAAEAVEQTAKAAKEAEADLKAITLVLEEIDELPIVVLAEPDFTTVLPRNKAGKAYVPQPPKGIGTDIKAQAALAKRLLKVRRELDDIAAQPVLTNGGPLELYIDGVLTACKGIVGVVYTVANGHRDALGGHKLKVVS